MKNLLNLKLPTAIIFDNITNKLKNRLIEENTYFNKPSFIKLNQILFNSFDKNASNTIQSVIDN